MRILLLFIFFIFFSVLKAQEKDNTFAFTDTSVEKGMMLTITALDYSNDINKYYFDLNKIDSLIYFMELNPLVYVEIVCNSDYSESPLLTMMATSDQALEIRRYMVQHKIQGSRIDIYGNGEMNLLVTEADKIYMDEEAKNMADKKNRRIEVTIIKIKEENYKKNYAGLRSYIN